MFSNQVCRSKLCFFLIGTVIQIDEVGHFLQYPAIETKKQIEVAILTKAAHYYYLNSKKFEAESALDSAMGDVEFSLDEAQQKRDCTLIFYTFLVDALYETAEVYQQKAKAVRHNEP